MDNSKSICIITCSLFLFSFLGVNSSDPHFANTSCSNAGIFTKGSIYEENLKSLLLNLSTYEDSFYATGFQTATWGQSPDVVYGMFLCEGQVSVDNCRECIKVAARVIIVETCSLQKTVITWYENCMLRYSDVNFTGLMETVPSFMRSREKDIPDPSLLYKQFTLIYKLIDMAQRSEKFYDLKKEEDGRYGMVQCTRDINASACGSCLKTLTKEVERKREGKIGWQMYGPSCMLRYESLAPSPDLKLKIILLAVVPSVAAAVAFLVIFYCAFSSRRRRSRKVPVLPKSMKGKNQGLDLDGAMMDEEHDDGHQMRYISLRTIVDATNGFSDDNKLGKGGFGPVYKGKLPNGDDVAIKRLSRKSSQGLREFKNEVSLIIKLQHRNLVKLLGYCFEEDEKILVYEYMSNKSLDAFLFDPLKSKELNWEMRMRIIHGTTRGLQYLHEDSRLKIIHRDLKPSNILLDCEMNPKISDFGTARIFGCQQMEDSTEKIVGTIGYMSPEYALGGMISEKSDIYSFGVLLLEIISGKKVNRLVSHNNQQHSLISYAWESWCETRGLNMINDKESIMGNSCLLAEAMRCVHIALLCLQYEPIERPTISQIIDMLRNKNELLQPKQPSFMFRNDLDFDQPLVTNNAYSVYELSQTTLEAR